jgi:hypothetical protein
MIPNGVLLIKKKKVLFLKKRGWVVHAASGRLTVVDWQHCNVSIQSSIGGSRGLGWGQRGKEHTCIYLWGMKGWRLRPGVLYVASKLRSFTPGPIQGISYRELLRIDMRCFLLYNTNIYFNLREWVHQLQPPGRGGIDRGNRWNGCWDTASGQGSKAVGVACLESTNWVRVTLVMGSSIRVILEVALLTVWSDWPPCFTVAWGEMLPILPAVSWSKVSGDVQPAGIGMGWGMHQNLVTSRLPFVWSRAERVWCGLGPLPLSERCVRARFPDLAIQIRWCRYTYKACPRLCPGWLD